MITKEILKKNILYRIYIPQKSSSQGKIEGERVLPEIINSSNAINGNQTNKDSYNNSISSTLANERKDLYDEFIHKHESILTSMLISDLNESGVSNPSEKYFDKIFKENSLFSLNLIMKIFMDHFSNNHRYVTLLISVLHMLSHYEYRKVYPTAQSIAIDALSHKDVEVQEYAIKCFENWKHPNGIEKLKAIKFNTGWLEEYANDVIKELEEVQENVVFG